MPGGRPPMYSTPEEMKTLIDEYFNERDEQGKPYTVTSLALKLGFTTRQGLLNYEDKKEFVDTLKEAKLRIEGFAEDALYDKSKPTAGVIFNLTNNYGWQNKYINENTNKNEDVTPDEQANIDKVLDADDE